MLKLLPVKVGLQSQGARKYYYLKTREGGNEKGPLGVAFQTF